MSPLMQTLRFCAIFLILSQLCLETHSFTLSSSSSLNNVRPLSKTCETIISHVFGGESQMFSIQVDAHHVMNVSISPHDNVTVLLREGSLPTTTKYDRRVSSSSRSISVWITNGRFSMLAIIRSTNS